MPKTKQFSGKEVVKILESNGFIIKRTVGSHIRMTLSQDGSSFHITIPLHDNIKKGTLHSIIWDFELCLGKEKAKIFFIDNYKKKIAISRASKKFYTSTQIRKELGL